jgi:hypothetical protein
MNHEGSTFISACAPMTGLLFFAKEADELVEDDTPNSSFFSFYEKDEQRFRKYDEMTGWPAISMATVKPDGGRRLVVAIGPNGDYWEMDAPSADEHVGKLQDFRGNLRKLAVVDDQIYACGMNRVLLQRAAAGRWVSRGPGAQKGDPAVVGFEDVAGYGSAEMYAVGWAGEIWWGDHDKWRAVDSPTSVNLTALTCASDGFVYAVGHEGMLLKGRRDAWSVVATELDANLRDVAWRDGKLLAVSDFDILVYEKGAFVPASDFADEEDQPATCLHLLEASDGLVSVGTKDVFVRRDGGLWTRLV